jgi:hypothetical protein
MRRILMKIDTECAIRKRVTVTPSGNQKKINLPKIFDDNGLDVLKVGDEIELCMDLKNKIIFFRYAPEAASKAQD